ncbi:hypothetical protein PI27_gp198 [Listeria phage WIL-1]|nr:hypothetical protein PI27_gp198 [Listeria phage WIL-1]
MKKLLAPFLFVPSMSSIILAIRSNFFSASAVKASTEKR